MNEPTLTLFTLPVHYGRLILVMWITHTLSLLVPSVTTIGGTQTSVKNHMHIYHAVLHTVEHTHRGLKLQICQESE